MRESCGFVERRGRASSCRSRRAPLAIHQMRASSRSRHPWERAGQLAIEVAIYRHWNFGVYARVTLCGVRERGFGETGLRMIDGADAGVHLAMAVGAEHH